MKRVPKTIFEDFKFINIWAISIQDRCKALWGTPKFTNELKPLLDELITSMEKIQVAIVEGTLTEAHVSEVKLVKAEIDFVLS